MIGAVPNCSKTKLAFIVYFPISRAFSLMTHSLILEYSNSTHKYGFYKLWVIQKHYNAKPMMFKAMVSLSHCIVHLCGL